MGVFRRLKEVVFKNQMEAYQQASSLAPRQYYLQERLRSCGSNVVAYGRYEKLQTTTLRLHTRLQSVGE